MDQDQHSTWLMIALYQYRDQKAELQSAVVNRTNVRREWETTVGYGVPIERWDSSLGTLIYVVSSEQSTSVFSRYLRCGCYNNNPSSRLFLEESSLGSKTSQRGTSYFPLKVRLQRRSLLKQPQFCQAWTTAVIQFEVRNTMRAFPRY
jgi:hypothetical protein